MGAAGQVIWVYQCWETTFYSMDLQFGTRCSKWQLFIQLNRCKLHSSECLFKNQRTGETCL